MEGRWGNAQGVGARTGHARATGVGAAGEKQVPLRLRRFGMTSLFLVEIRAYDSPESVTIEATGSRNSS